MSDWSGSTRSHGQRRLSASKAAYTRGRRQYQRKGGFILAILVVLAILGQCQNDASAAQVRCLAACRYGLQTLPDGAGYPQVIALNAEAAKVFEVVAEGYQPIDRDMAQAVAHEQRIIEQDSAGKYRLTKAGRLVVYWLNNSNVRKANEVLSQANGGL